MRKYVHIGFPKCASTSLQNSFFSNHPELYHLGSGFNGINGRYIDRDIARVVESDLRFKKEFLWRPETVTGVLDGYFKKASAQQGCRAVGLSSEFLGFTLGNEIDVMAKARRLRQVFGKNTTIIMVIREQMDLLKSLYREMVKGGYPGTWRNFLEYTFLYQDRNWCHDFCFDRVLDAYSDLFGRENVLVLPFEQLKQDRAGFLQALCKGLGISPFENTLMAKNAASDPAELELLRRCNEKWPHEFGSPFFQPFHSTRLKAWFEDELGVKAPQERLLDDAVRGPLTDITRQLLAQGNMAPLDTAVPEILGKRLSEIYGPSNVRLAERVDFDLAAYGYVLDP
jgi:hypothetical protein